jgi:hypothetical protein
LLIEPIRFIAFVKKPAHTGLEDRAAGSLTAMSLRESMRR